MVLAVLLCYFRSLPLLLLLLLTVWTDVVRGEFVGNFTERDPARLKRQTCNANSFVCKSGQCIDFENVCDGKADCMDTSDETRETCTALNIRCPPFAFRCNYGGCVDGDAKCNGKFDCVDLSDETVPGCKTPLPNPLKPPTSQGGCKGDEFRCTSGQCVDSFSLCDGNADCDDKSDETVEQCRSFTCPGLAFRCSYGACVDGGARCDGVRQCADGSDEDPAVCGTTTPATGPGPGSATACVLPQQPSNGRYTVNNCDDSTPVCRGVGGTPVSTPVLLSYSCNDGYVLAGKDSVFCFGGKLAPQPPTCQQATCPSLGSTSVLAECTLNGKAVNCNAGPSSVGTVARLTCQVSYQKVKELGYDQIQCSSSGQWTPPPFTCTPVCGTRNPNGTEYLSNGEIAKVGEFPWVVGVYRNSTKDFKMQQICGGSLISTRLVVSAAHCFWNDRIKGQLPKERFKMAVGKYYRDWYNNKEEELQIRDAAEIKVHERYQGRKLNLANDIAVIKLNVSIELTWAVRPVCIDWKNEYERFQFIPGKQGSVAGWGVTEKGEPSTVLMTAKLPFVDFYTCWNTVPESFQSYVTMDKFCAGYNNGTNISVCPGDSGGGLAFEHNKLWYLRGIVSVGISPEDDAKCYTDQYTAFTTVSNFLPFVKEDYP